MSLRYVREKRARRLQECTERIDQAKSDIKEIGASIEGVRGVIANIDKEISESGASEANLRENIRVRKLIKDIKAVQEKIDSYNMEEAARARRIYAERFPIEKQKETEMQSKVSSLGLTFFTI